MEKYSLSPTIGTIQEDKIVGREKEIISLLRLLKGQSVTVEEIRRMGKTLLVQKLAYLCNENKLSDEFKKDEFKAKYFTFQGKQNLGEVIDYLIRELEKMKEWYHIDLTKSYNVLRKLLNSPKLNVYGAELTINLPEYKKNWKELFYKILEDIANSQDVRDTKLILIFDELPIMLWEWYKKGNHQDAIEFLDILRERRQLLENKGIRFIFCGSIGMKVVLSRLQKEFGYTGEATNEMEEFNVGAFDLDEVKFLCDCYTLSGFAIAENDTDKIWKQIHKLSNGIPFYISNIFNILQTEFDKVITKKNVDKAYQVILNDTKKHKAFNQLIQRIDIYYPKAKGKSMKLILNYLAKQNDFLEEEDIIKSVDLEKENVKSTLYDLLSDHYLLREIKKEKRYYKFKYEIFKQWWSINIA